MEIKTIIRIESPKDGLGLFRSIDDPLDKPKFKKLWARHTTNGPKGGFPTPSNEGLEIYKDDKRWFCAFKSLSQFQKWVKPSEARNIVKEGFKILLLEVNDYQESKMQIIYTKESITSMKDISSLF